MHRNTFINSPELLDETFNLKKNRNIFFAGQITGVEGYVESIASGLVAALNAIKMYEEKNSKEQSNKNSINQNKTQNNKIIFPEETMIGALSKYIATPNENFQPMNANFGILPSLDEKIKDKKLKYTKLSDRALEKLKMMLQ